ncbi:MAG: FAD-dependent oxidoreductase [Patescibacteria group bacterium]
MKTENNIFILKEKIKETDDVISLKFIPSSGEIFTFLPGQFIMVSLPNNKLPNQNKAYTISSAPGEKFLTITVKKIGVFSGALHNLKIGDKIQTSKPQGFFCLNNNIKDCIFLAGGIGITPFYSMIKSCLYSSNNDRNIYLFYSNKTKNDVVFWKELEEISLRLKNFKMIHLLTRDKNKYTEIKESQRINCDILKKYLKTLEQKHYYICGPIGFVNDLWRELKNEGAKEEEILTETFY